MGAIGLILLSFSQFDGAVVTLNWKETLQGVVLLKLPITFSQRLEGVLELLLGVDNFVVGKRAVHVFGITDYP